MVLSFLVKRIIHQLLQITILVTCMEAHHYLFTTATLQIIVTITYYDTTHSHLHNTQVF